MNLKGLIVKGHGIASGKAKDSPYPQGSIAMQLPFFKEKGLDLSMFFSATLNVDISPMEWQPLQADYTFKNIKWTSVIPPEHFSFFKCFLVYEGKKYKAVIYYPHPETKVTHFQNNSIVEIITEKIDKLSYGKAVVLEIDTHKIAVK